VRAATGKPGVAAALPQVTLTDRTTGRLVEVAPLLSRRLAGFGAAGAARVEAGPAADLWSIDGEWRARLTGIAAVAYEWHLAGHVTGTVRIEGTVGSSVFDAVELPSQLERRSTWRYGTSLGLRYRL
jgi:hypothetical protein